MSQIQIKFCPICESARIEYAFISRGNQINKCKDCDFMFLNPQPSDEVLAYIYSDGYFLKEKTPEDEEQVQEMKKATADLYIQQLLSLCGESRGRLLDVGCENGDFLVAARAQGFEVEAIEINEHAAKEANARLKKEYVRCGNIETMELPANRYDICVLFDTLEHTRDPIAVLSKVYNALKLGGLLYVAVPTLDSWSFKLFKNNWTAFKTEHLQYFDNQTIQYALWKTDFSQIMIKPNVKNLTLDYINNHFQRFEVPLFTRLISWGVSLLPVFLKRRKFNISASGVNVLCRKTEIRQVPLVSIIVPVYNERATFTTLMDGLLQKQLQGAEKEVVLVESNSTDGSREDVLRYKDCPGVKVILEDRPRGKGHAVRTGFQHASGDVLMIQDADLEYDLNDYDQLLEPILKYRKAFILGSRYLKGWKIREFNDQPVIAFVMNIAHHFCATLLSLVCGVRMTDPFTMFKVFRRDCLYGLTFEANRFDFDWELVIKLLRKGYKPLELGVNYHSRSFREGKKISFFRDPPMWIWAAVKFRLQPLFDNYR